MQPTAIYNPFILPGRLHFPSFTEEFGDLLKLEAENLRKEERRLKQLDSKPSLVTPNINTPIPQKSKSKSKFKTNVPHARYAPVTPIPAKSKHKNPPSNCVSESANPNKLRHDYNAVGTPVPRKKASFRNNSNMSIVVTPAPKKNKKRIASNTAAKDDEEDDESLVIMMADLMSPNPSHRGELSSPAPHDKNAKLLTRNPVQFPIVMPPTPLPNAKQRKKRSAEEKWCNDYFSKHVPILTPMKKRENPVKLYDPSHDTNITVMLVESDTPFEPMWKRAKEAKAVDLLGDISMIAPITEPRQTTTEPQDIDTPFLSFKKANKNVFFTPNKNANSVPAQNYPQNSNELSIFGVGTALSFLTPNDGNGGKLGLFGGNPPSDIKKEEKEESFDAIHKMNKRRETRSENGNGNKNEDDLLLSIDAMDDDEFFGTSEIDINSNHNSSALSVMEDQSTQTEPVLVVAEEDIPKIRYNGKLITEIDSLSMSAIYYDEYNKHNERLNTSNHSTQSEKIVYSTKNNRKYNLFTPMLRHNQESIDSFYDMSSASDSDSDCMSKRNMLSLSYNKNSNDKRKKKRNGNEMLKAYKQSKLAHNPNWTVCNEKRKNGELL